MWTVWLSAPPTGKVQARSSALAISAVALVFVALMIASNVMTIMLNHPAGS